MENLSAYKPVDNNYSPNIRNKHKIKNELLDVMKKFDLLNHEIIIKTTDGGIAWIRVTETIK